MTNYPPISAINSIAVEAGKLIMEHYNNAPGDITLKDDQSPVTAADIAANDYIVRELQKLTPTIPIVAEEHSAEMNNKLANSPLFWLVDPLDGTKSFIKRKGEFTVNIALIDHHIPVMGVVYVPVTEVLYYGESTHAWKQEAGQAAKVIHVAVPGDDGAIVIASLSHRTPETDDYIERIKVKSLISASSSVKFCLLAEGAAHVYPRFGRTMEWDTAAGHAVLIGAGGCVTNIDDTPFMYGKKLFENPYFIAYGGRSGRRK